MLNHQLHLVESPQYLGLTVGAAVIGFFAGVAYSVTKRRSPGRFTTNAFAKPIEALAAINRKTVGNLMQNEISQAEALKKLKKHQKDLNSINHLYKLLAKDKFFGNDRLEMAIDEAVASSFALERVLRERAYAGVSSPELDGTLSRYAADISLGSFNA